MTKEQVIQLFVDKKSNESLFNDLMRALQQAPLKNLSLVSFYNRSGFSKQRLKSLIYDVKKAWAIKDADIKKVSEADKEPVLSEELQQKLAEADLEKMNYNDELKPLAAEIAKELNYKFLNQKKDTLLGFLSQKKSEYGLNEPAKDPESDQNSETENNQDKKPEADKDQKPEDNQDKKPEAKGKDQ